MIFPVSSYNYKDHTYVQCPCPASISFCLYFRDMLLIIQPIKMLCICFRHGHSFRAVHSEDPKRDLPGLRGQRLNIRCIKSKIRKKILVSQDAQRMKMMMTIILVLYLIYQSFSCKNLFSNFKLWTPTTEYDMVYCPLMMFDHRITSFLNSQRRMASFIL